MQNASALFNKTSSSPQPTIKLRRIKIKKEVLEKYRFCRNSGNEAYSRGWGGGGGGGHIVCVIMTYWVGKLISDSPLTFCKHITFPCVRKWFSIDTFLLSFCILNFF